MEQNQTDITEAGEEVVYEAHRHWAMVLPPFLLLILAGLSIPSRGGKAWGLVLLSLAWILVSWLNVRSCRFSLTRTRLLAHIGFPWRKVQDIPLATVGTVDVYQPALGKVLDFGKIRILCTDGSRKYYKMVTTPHVLVRMISEYRAALGEKKPEETT